MKNGFKVLDSDLHTMEPDGLWEKYLDAPFKKFAPQFTRGSENASNQPIIRIGALEIGEMSKRRQTAVVGKDLQQRAFARHPHYEVAHARGYDSESHVAKGLLAHRAANHHLPDGRDRVHVAVAQGAQSDRADAR